MHKALSSHELFVLVKIEVKLSREINKVVIKVRFVFRTLSMIAFFGEIVNG